MSKPNNPDKETDRKIKYHFYIDKDGDLSMVSDRIKQRFNDMPPMKCALMVKQDDAHEYGFKMY
jgi:hypothetical protein